MNKADLVDAVASELGETRAAAARAVDAVLRQIADGVARHERLTLAGFGSFERKRRQARTGVNPSTRQKMTIQAGATVGFKPSKALKERL